MSTVARLQQALTRSTLPSAESPVSPTVPARGPTLPLGSSPNLVERLKASRLEAPGVPSFGSTPPRGLQPSATGSDKVASAADVAQFAGRVIARPSAFVIGESHGIGPIKGGNYALIPTNGSPVTWFASTPVLIKGRPVELLGGKLGVVGTVNSKTQEAGVGLAGTVPTPVGDLLFFANARQNKLTASGLVSMLRGQANNPGGKQEPLKVSLNVGGAYSVSDGLLMALAGPTKGTSLAIKAAADRAKIDAWAGVAYRGEAEFSGGQLSKLSIAGQNVPLDRIGEFFSGKVKETRQSPPIIPNRGNAAIASYNNTLQVAFGQSPWVVSHMDKKRTPDGQLVMRNGTVDVLNHGNSVSAVAEPIYELGVKTGMLAPNEPIRNNAHAGQVIDGILGALGKGPTPDYLAAVGRLSNPYGLNFGSTALQIAQKGLGLTLGQSLKAPPPDAAFVKSVFQGQLRHPGDMKRP